MRPGDYLSWRAAAHPDRLALVDVREGLRLSYGALNARADRLARALREAGVGRGDRVALLAPDGVAHFDLFFACGKLGAVSVPLNRRLAPAELRAQLACARPALTLAADVDPEALPGARAWRALLACAEALGGDEPVWCDALPLEATACLLFTGGTTGAPKAAQISHRQVVFNAFSTALADVREEDVYLNVFPLFHAGGLFAFSVPLLLLGGAVVQVPHFDADAVLRLLADERATLFAGVPTVFARLAEAETWERADLSSLRYCLSGGAPLPVSLVRRYAQEKGVVFRQGFGMTEFGPGAFSLPAAEAERRAGSIGRPNAFVEARVVDPETGAACAPGQTGELLLRGPHVMAGYWQRPEATAEVLCDGWLRTGDLARTDAEGFYTIVGRRKEMFISGGENVYPSEVEAALLAHPGVAEAAVVGVPDARWGEVGHAFVVPRKEAAPGEAELLAFLRARLAGYKVPRAVVFRDTLPLSEAGKVLKRRLLEELNL
ncbi:MAG: class I adenylate-forming enzyme family protein [Rubricoccaceae bacterium]